MKIYETLSNCSRRTRRYASLHVTVIVLNYARSGQALVHWKVEKSQLLEQLQSKLSKFERWNNIDVDKLLVELDKKDSELRVCALPSCTCMCVTLPLCRH